MKNQLLIEYYHRIIEDLLRITPVFALPPEEGGRSHARCAGHEPRVSEQRIFKTRRTVSSLAVKSATSSPRMPLSFRPLHPAAVAGYAVALPLPPLPWGCSLFGPESPVPRPVPVKFDLSERPERVKGPKRLAALGGFAA